MVIKFFANEGSAPAGKLADCELWFDAGDVLAGFKLIGFAVWERTRRPGEFNVTFPARSYAVNGERRSFALLRPLASEDRTDVQAGLRDAIIEAWREHLQAAA